MSNWLLRKKYSLAIVKRDYLVRNSDGQSEETELPSAREQIVNEAVYRLKRHAANTGLLDSAAAAVSAQSTSPRH